MVLTRARSAAVYDEMMRLRRASMLLARGAAWGGRRSARLAVARFSLATAFPGRLARFNRKMAKYSFCQLIGDITPSRCLEKMLGRAYEDIDIVAADPAFRAALHQSVRVQRLLAPSEVDRVNRRWRSVKRSARRSAAFSY